MSLGYTEAVDIQANPMRFFDGNTTASKGWFGASFTLAAPGRWIQIVIRNGLTVLTILPAADLARRNNQGIITAVLIPTLSIGLTFAQRLAKTGEVRSVIRQNWLGQGKNHRQGQEYCSKQFAFHNGEIIPLTKYFVKVIGRKCTRFLRSAQRATMKA